MRSKTSRKDSHFGVRILTHTNEQPAASGQEGRVFVVVNESEAEGMHLWLVGSLAPGESQFPAPGSAPIPPAEPKSVVATCFLSTRQATSASSHMEEIGGTPE